MAKLSSILLIICIVTSLLSVLYKSRPRYLIAFPVYFLISYAVQLYGNYLGQNGKTNIPLYNTYATLEISFFFFILVFIIRRPAIRKTLLVLCIAFPAFSFLNLHLIQGNSVFLTISYGVGCLLIAVFCIVYFVELFQMPKAMPLSTSPEFWICTATLFNYTCTFPFWGMVNLLTLSYRGYDNAFTMVTVINILSYILYIIGFLCRIRIRKSIS